MQFNCTPVWSSLTVCLSWAVSCCGILWASCVCPRLVLQCMGWLAVGRRTVNCPVRSLLVSGFEIAILAGPFVTFNILAHTPPTGNIGSLCVGQFSSCLVCHMSGNTPLTHTRMCSIMEVVSLELACKQKRWVVGLHSNQF